VAAAGFDDVTREVGDRERALMAEEIQGLLKTIEVGAVPGPKIEDTS